MYNLNNETKKATRDGFGSALVKLGEKNQKVVALAAGAGDSTRAFKFKEKFPERFIEVGIAEQNMIGIAAGLALAGKLPFPSTFAAFLPGRCYDQIRQSVCYSDLNVKLVSSHAGITVGADGATHQMMEDIAMLRATPNLTIIVPCDALETEKAVFAVAEMIGPTYIRCGREKTPVFTLEDTPFEIGKSVILRRGNDATIIACGLMVYYSLIASETLEKEGISVRVINMHTIKPIDREAILKAASETGAIITAEEHQINGGLGSAVAEVLVENNPVPMQRIGMKDCFGESGKPSQLLEKYQMNDKAIIQAVKEVTKRKSL
ncbi:transketolase family protein [Candidatus Woesearchaeota archaeon]|nr:transketolase family protein [Candidatus Woesearchaeota archaeon]